MLLSCIERPSDRPQALRAGAEAVGALTAGSPARGEAGTVEIDGLRISLRVSVRTEGLGVLKEL